MSKIINNTLGALGVLLIALTFLAETSYAQSNSSRRSADERNDSKARMDARRSRDARNRSRIAKPRINAARPRVKTSKPKTSVALARTNKAKPRTSVALARTNKNKLRTRPQEAPKKPIVRKPVVVKPRKPIVRKPVVVKPKRPIIRKPIDPGCINRHTVITPLFPVVPVPAPAPHASCAPPCGCSGALHVNLGGFGFAIGGCNHNFVWVEPVVEVVQVQIWVEDTTIEVWVEDVIGTYTDPCGHQHQIVVAPAGWRSVVIPGHFELRDETRVVTAGYWTRHGH